MRSYAIGDVHGHIDKLRAVQDWIAADKARVKDPEAPIVHVGDFPDRGPDVAAVLRHLQQGIREGAPWVMLKGNHDRMMYRFLQARELRDNLRHDLHWLQANIGGRATLASYGVDVGAERAIADIHADAIAAVPQSDVDFLGALPTSYQRGGVFFCHAGVRPGVPLNEQSEDDLVWIRREFLEDPRDFGALIVHGHTPVDTVTHYGNRLNIDSGAAYGGPLSAVVIEGPEVFRITPEGRVPVLPQGRAG